MVRHSGLVLEEKVRPKIQGKRWFQRKLPVKKRVQARAVVFCR